MIPATYIYHAHSDHWGETFPPTDVRTGEATDAAPPSQPRLLHAAGRLIGLLSGRLMRPAHRSIDCPAHCPAH